MPHRLNKNEAVQVLGTLLDGSLWWQAGSVLHLGCSGAVCSEPAAVMPSRSISKISHASRLTACGLQPDSCKAADQACQVGPPPR